ncbi:MAG: hypothetical protein PHI31_04955 [Desulfuromonadaceae bacterium]|nr:hypothetical protein [Desulfuromonadaceae bacterium]
MAALPRTAGPLQYVCTLLTAAVIIGLVCRATAEAEQPRRTSSVHAGFLYPAGVDVAGYTAEVGLSDHWYWYYTFGFPSLAATGFSCYADYDGNGPVATAGVGIGSVAYASVVYQLRVADNQYLKLGGGYTTGVAYTGLYPALSYEMRFR